MSSPIPYRDSLAESAAAPPSPGLSSLDQRRLLSLDQRRLARRGRLWLGIGLALWGITVAAAMALLADYASRPGETGAAPTRLNSSQFNTSESGSSDSNPSEIGTRRIAPATAGHHQLLLFVHPHCPCSRATIAELERIMSRVADRVDATLYLFRPPDEPDDWTFGPLRDAAAAIPGLRIEVDADGRLAEHFGAHTSGDVLLYEPAGRLVFHGGITSARGHEGDNLGKAAVLAALLGQPAATTETPVFGCTLSPRRPSPADGRKPSAD